MDLQMPEMDGYTAATEIRKLNEPKFKSIPIIALTASAFLDTKAKVLEAGMTNYISKTLRSRRVISDFKKNITKKNNFPIEF